MKLLMATLILAVLVGCATPMTQEQEAAYVEETWGELCKWDVDCMADAYNRDLEQQRALSNGIGAVFHGLGEGLKAGAHANDHVPASSMTTTNCFAQGNNMRCTTY